MLSVQPVPPALAYRAILGLSVSGAFDGHRAWSCRRRCVARNEKERKFTLAWNVCGDILLDLKVLNRNRARSRLRRAPMAVDAQRLCSRLRRRRARGPIELSSEVDGAGVGIVADDMPIDADDLLSEL